MDWSSVCVGAFIPTTLAIFFFLKWWDTHYKLREAEDVIEMTRKANKLVKEWQK